MIRFITLLICFSSVLSAQKMFPSDAVPEAIETIYTKIKERHPYPATFEGLEALDAARTQVLGEVEATVKGKDSIPYYTFAGLASPLQEATNCGHLILETYLDSTETQAVRGNRYPLRMIQIDAGDFVLLRGLKSTTDSLPPGTVISTINGRKVSPLIRELAPFSGINDNRNEDALLYKVAYYPMHLYQSYYGPQDSIIISVTTEVGTAKDYVVRAKKTRYVDPKKNKTPIGKTLKFEFTEDGETGILTINKFSAYKFSDGNYYKFLRNVFDTLKTTGTDQLIIDIRNNGGGRSGRINALYHYLADQKFYFTADARMTGPARAEPGENAKTTRRREAGAVTKKERRLQRSLSKPRKPAKEKKRYTGKVVVLINELSFSASGLFARMVQGYDRGKLVGGVSGASANIMYGASKRGDPILIGPNEDFELKVNTIGLLPKYPIPGNITPDYIVRPTLEGIRTGKDEQMEKALEVVKE
jgi:hypothetical protein